MRDEVAHLPARARVVLSVQQDVDHLGVARPLCEIELAAALHPQIAEQVAHRVVALRHQPRLSDRHADEHAGVGVELAEVAGAARDVPRVVRAGRELVHVDHVLADAQAGRARGRDVRGARDEELGRQQPDDPQLARGAERELAEGCRHVGRDARGHDRHVEDVVLVLVLEDREDDLLPRVAAGDDAARLQDERHQLLEHDAEAAVERGGQLGRDAVERRLVGHAVLSLAVVAAARDLDEVRVAERAPRSAQLVRGAGDREPRVRQARALAEALLRGAVLRRLQHVERREDRHVADHRAQPVGLHVLELVREHVALRDEPRQRLLVAEAARHHVGVAALRG